MKKKFNFGKLLANIGGRVIRDVIPGANTVLDLVNAAAPNLPALTDSATGTEIQKRVDSLPEADRAELLTKELDVEIVEIQETNETLRTMLTSDAVNPHSTRPLIALIMTWYIVGLGTAIVGIWAYGVIAGKADIVDAVTGGWPMVVVLLGIPGALLKGYFGLLAHEQGNKLAAANGQPIRALSGVLKIAGKLLNR